MSSRRGFLFKLGLALNVVGAALVGIPVIGFITAPMRRAGGQSWIQVGSVANFPEGETRLAIYRNPVSVEWDGATANTACWVRHVQGDRFQVFAVNCTHLGCPVRWLPEANLFLCPCHGGVYNKDGTVAGGPPPRPLVQYSVRVQNDQVQVLAGESPLA